MVKENRQVPEELAALLTRFEAHSRKAQAYYTVMHEARKIVGSDDAASAWMEQAVAALDGKTPAVLVSEGRAEDVLAYISSVKPSSSA